MLNGDNSLSPPPTCEEKRLLDDTLVPCLEETDKAKCSIMSFLAQFINENVTSSKSKNKNKSNIKMKPMTNKKKKRNEYIKLQELYKKNRKAAYNKVVAESSFSEELKHEPVFSYWRNLMTKPDYTSFVPSMSNKNIDINYFVTPEEVAKVKMKYSTAPGPDNLTVKGLNKINIRQRAKLYSIFLKMSWVPDVILSSRTIFIPKGINVSEPSRMRPITISSVMLRRYHKIIAARLMKNLTFDSNQFGFRPLDGIAEAVKIMSSIQDLRKEHLMPINAAFLDVAKAFDSVSHKAIIGILRERGLNNNFVQCIEKIYKRSKTMFCFGGEVSDPVYPTRGIRQGDPLSSIMFLLIMDFILKHLSPNLGIHVVGKQIAYMAYADDVGLFAENPLDQQSLLDKVCEVMPKVGLDLNPEKCFTFSWISNKKKKICIFNKK